VTRPDLISGFAAMQVTVQLRSRVPSLSITCWGFSILCITLISYIQITGPLLRQTEYIQLNQTA
jgi:hypothetical protein